MTFEVFSSIRTLLETNLLGSTTLFAIVIIAFLVILVLAAKVSFKIALIILLPALLVVFGIGVQEGLLGINYRWIAVMIVIGLAVGVMAIIYAKIGGEY